MDDDVQLVLGLCNHSEIDYRGAGAVIIASRVLTGFMARR
jgi:hypothetical protein